MPLGNNHLTGFRMQNVFLNGTPEDSLADRNDNITAVNNWTNNNAAFRAAVGFGNNHVLSHVNQTAGQITGVCGLQRRIGQTFTGTVGRIEVFQHRQTFFKV